MMEEGGLRNFLSALRVVILRPVHTTGYLFISLKDDRLGPAAGDSMIQSQFVQIVTRLASHQIIRLRMLG